MAQHNPKATSRPLAQRTKGGAAKTTEGGHARTSKGGQRGNDVKQPNMPTNAMDTAKNSQTQNKTQHAGGRTHGKGTCTAW